MGKFTELELKFIKENYHKYGPKYCGVILNRNPESTGNKARGLGLSARNSTKHDMFKPVSVEQFHSINNNLAYFLGYFFADGNIFCGTYSNNITQHRIAIEIQEEDGKDIQDIMSAIGRWSIQKRKRKDTWKETWTYVTNNKELFFLLQEWGFGPKSNKFPTKLLDSLDGEKLSYFWKGFFDGDGSAGLSGRCSCVSFTASHDFEWADLCSFLKRINIYKFNIYHTANKRGTGSVLKVYGKEALKLINHFPEFGLKRKITKLALIKAKYH